jgi:hypothetical protein
MHKRRSAIRSLFLSTALVLGFPVVGSANSQKLDDHLLQMHIDGSRLVAGSVFATVAKLASVYRVPIGFEERIKAKTSDSKPSEVENQIAPFQGTLESFLNYIMQLEPGYAWECRDGVINIFPTSQRDPRLAEILDTRIREFTLRKMRGVMGAGDAICQTPEVASKLTLLGVTPVHYYQNGELERPISQKAPINITDMKVRDVLNLLLKYDGGEMWTAARWGPDNSLLTITLR